MKKLCSFLLCLVATFPTAAKLTSGQMKALENKINQLIERDATLHEKKIRSLIADIKKTNLHRAQPLTEALEEELKKQQQHKTTETAALPASVQSKTAKPTPLPANTQQTQKLIAQLTPAALPAMHAFIFNNAYNFDTNDAQRAFKRHKNTLSMALTTQLPLTERVLNSLAERIRNLHTLEAAHHNVAPLFTTTDAYNNFMLETLEDILMPQEARTGTQATQTFTAKINPLQSTELATFAQTHQEHKERFATQLLQGISPEQAQETIVQLEQQQQEEARRHEKSSRTVTFAPEEHLTAVHTIPAKTEAPTLNDWQQEKVYQWVFEKNETRKNKLEQELFNKENAPLALYKNDKEYVTELLSAATNKTNNPTPENKNEYRRKIMQDVRLACMLGLIRTQ